MMVATLLEPDLGGLGHAIRLHEAETDLFEVRFDAFEVAPAPADVRPLTRKPLIATCRRPSDGGRFHGEEHNRLALLERAVAAGFEFVDLEGSTQLPVAPETVVRSFHNLKATPPLDELLRLGRQMGPKGTRIKIATKVHSFSDVVALLQAIRRLRRHGFRPSVMGLGDFPRVLAHLIGNEWTYGGARTTAPGQPRLRDLLSMLDHWGRPAPAPHLFLVVGAPVAHSFSPRIHNAAFRATGYPAAYGALEVRTDEELAALLAAAPDLGLRGLSVTSPLKEAAYALARQRTTEADRAKSVNALRIDGDTTVGHNTDGSGAARVLSRLLEARPRSGPVLLVGTGGAARGILAAAKREFVVAGRTHAKRRAIENEFGVGTLSLEDAARRLDHYAAVVNATNVEDPLPLEATGGALFDLHYGAQPTVWESAARERGLPFAGGRELLLEQALDAFEFWTGHTAPRDAMTQALGSPA